MSWPDVDFVEVSGGKLSIRASLIGRSTVLAGEKIVASSTTPEVLATSTPCSSVTVQAKSSNTKSVFLGNATGQYLELLPGASIAVAVSNLNLIYVKVQVNGEGVNYLGVA